MSSDKYLNYMLVGDEDEPVVGDAVLEHFYDDGGHYLGFTHYEVLEKGFRTIPIVRP